MDDGSKVTDNSVGNGGEDSDEISIIVHKGMPLCFKKIVDFGEMTECSLCNREAHLNCYRI